MGWPGAAHGAITDRIDCGQIRLLFAYTDSMFQMPPSRVCDFVVVCKGCMECIPAPVETMPDLSIDGPTCGRLTTRSLLRWRCPPRRTRRPFPPDAAPGAWLYRQRTLPPHHRPVSQRAALLPNPLQLHPPSQTSGAMPYALFRRSVRRSGPPLIPTLCLSSSIVREWLAVI